MMEQEELTNEKMKYYPFLKPMYQDSYFPNFLVDKGKDILINFCQAIETAKPENEDELYKISHSSVEEFNQLEDVFIENGSEIETVAREAIAADFSFIAEAYGYQVDAEEIIAPRNW